MFVPRNTAAGEVRIEAGVFSRSSGERLPLAGQDRGMRSYEVATLTVTPAANPVVNIGAVDGAAGAAGIFVEDEGVLIAPNQFSTLNFIGDGVVASDAGGGTADINIAGGGSDRTWYGMGVDGVLVTAGGGAGEDNSVLYRTMDYPMAFEYVRQAPLFEGIQSGAHCYFVHSYIVKPTDAGVAASYTHYGSAFVSSIRRDNVVACQFHPEKSQAVGLQVIKNFGDWK